MYTLPSRSAIHLLCNTNVFLLSIYVISNALSTTNKAPVTTYGTCRINVFSDCTKKSLFLRSSICVERIFSLYRQLRSSPTYLFILIIDFRRHSNMNVTTFFSLPNENEKRPFGLINTYSILLAFSK